MRWIGLLLLLCAALAPAELCTEDSYVQHYFDACLAEPMCRENFNLHSDERELFDYLLHTELVRPMQLSWRQLCRPDAFPLAMAMLCTHEFCKPNYILTGNEGCVCRNDKECAEKHPSWFRLSDAAKILLIVVLVVLVIYIGLSMLKELQKSTKPPLPSPIVPISAARNLDGIVLEVN